MPKFQLLGLSDYTRHAAADKSFLSSDAFLARRDRPHVPYRQKPRPPCVSRIPVMTLTFTGRDGAIQLPNDREPIRVWNVPGARALASTLAARLGYRLVTMGG